MNCTADAGRIFGLSVFFTVVKGPPRPRREWSSASTTDLQPVSVTPIRPERDNDDEQRLVRALREQRVEAITPAWNHFLPFVQRTLQHLANPGPDLEDLTQDVFERFFRKIPELRDPLAVRAFLYGITLRVAKRAQRYRWLRRSMQSAFDAEDYDVADTSIDAAAQEALSQLRTHLMALSTEQRSLLVCRYVEEMELRDVAAAHNLSFNTMRRRLEVAWGLLMRRVSSDEALAPYILNRNGGGS